MPKHSIRNVPRYFVPYTADCFQNAYGALVSYYNLNTDLILADYLSFMFDAGTGYIGMNFLHKPSRTFEFTKEEMNTSLEYVRFSPAVCYDSAVSSETEAAPDDKINICLYFQDDRDLAYQRLKELIAADIPVVVVVDLYYMSYHRAYGKDHGAHAVVVTGYDEEEGYIELFDKYSLSSSDFDGRIPVEEFKRARSSENFQGAYSKPIRNMWMEVEVDSRFHYNDRRWKAIITESCSRMLGEKDVLGFSCGLGAIDQLRRSLLLKKQELPAEELFPEYRHYYSPAFKIISRSRTRFGVFLKLLEAELPRGLAEEAVFQLEEAAKKWEIISNLSLRLAMTKNLSSIDNVCKQLEAIKDNESRAVDKLLGGLKTGG
ncbi:hypothetical protein CLHUN_12340 [Ruminiclostridium hungatei]|uniref:Butirosin biosynthesis protein H N-terminal domain-containing protein n=1 Tax=Ruminiclostridium hungatei TaxID=48256 RepID=A0A1V4SM86_RUMHU|nr:BtrH N-terminal domain-containing protein [Ruminiclostridium hungatei]OPX45002.1 hypothetical protein CLHUN_12340 [Ruminiclostridium hungatei]